MGFFRFSPVRLNKEGLTLFHGINERIRIEDYVNVVQFYYRLMSNADYDSQTRIKAGVLGGGDNEEEEDYEDFNAALENVDEDNADTVDVEEDLEGIQSSEKQ